MNQTENGEPNYGENATLGQGNVLELGQYPSGSPMISDYFDSREATYNRKIDEERRRTTALELSIRSFTDPTATLAGNDVIVRAKLFDRFIEGGQ